jgi:anti-sigma regulatory factor (Ser/Thr protein kinase)
MAATTTCRGNSRRGNDVRTRTPGSAAQAGLADPATADPEDPASPASPAAQAAPASLSIDGVPKNVAQARAFVAETVGADHPCRDVAVLLCSELVTNAVLHSNSCQAGGKVTVVVTDLTASVQVKVIDEGSASSIPVVKAEVYVAEGHGLFLVENLAEEWGYESDHGGTTVWFRVTP